MEIKPNSRFEPAIRTGREHPKVADPAVSPGGASFQQKAELDRALAETEEVRSEVVEEARLRASQPNYPPIETIHKIANLLAINLGRQI